MSDSLRDALEKLADSWERRPVKEAHSYPEANAYVDGQNDTYERSADVLRDLLSAHPAEPVGVSDEAVAVARLAYSEACKDAWGHDGAGRFRAALEAAAPLLGPRPLLDREAVTRIVSDVRALPVGESLTPYIDAVLELALPVPTARRLGVLLEQHKVGAFQPEHSACSCDRKWRTHAEYRDHLRDAVLALMGGAE